MPEIRISLNQIMVTLGERTQTVADWGHELGISRGTLRKRIERGVDGPELLAPAGPIFGVDRAAQKAAKPAKNKSEPDA